MKQAVAPPLLKIRSLFFLLAIAPVLVLPVRVAAQCSAPANPIVAENCQTGNPDSEWDVSTGDAGDPTIQGFATDISVNQGGTVYFKINTPARAYTITIYRMGYYGGMGARRIATVTPSVSLPQTQPACLTDTSTNLIDCGNWAVSASWPVPSNATSGIYFAHLKRTDTGGDSHIVFIVRNDASHSDILYQTSDEAWQAYNYYGNGSLYGPGSATFSVGSRAYKVSYNRPFVTRSFGLEKVTWLFGAEYPMVRWLEENGYDVTYFTGIDAARNGSLIKNHKIYISSGHDEYWSGPQRTNVEAARDAGVNLAFFSGNEVFWKVRWESSIDGTNTPYRTMVCYKETLASAKLDPADPPTWTGTWRDPTFSPPADGGRPENTLTGTLFMVNGTGQDNSGTQQITVPPLNGRLRFWRNTAVATNATQGKTYTLPPDTLGYEWDEDVDNGARPAGAFPLSTTTKTLTEDLLLDFGGTYGGGTATHHLMMYRAPSGALVFGAGTVQWAWGLDSNHDNPFDSNQTPDQAMQQATVNLFADMGVQPATLQSGLVTATASSDKNAPTSSIASPVSGASLPVGVPTTITATATDVGGVVAGIEVSGDGGATWHPASTADGQHWTYSWTPTQVGSATVLSRAVDDSGNLENLSSGVAVTVTEHDCPCNAWSSSYTPLNADSGDGTAVEVGVKFRADYNGYITGIRFYKSAANTGAHIGNLWSSTGSRLASATFTNETASGWQQVNFSQPVAITANTTYIASYFAPKGHYSADPDFFATSGLDDPPIHLLRNGVDGPNGVYIYTSQSAFPNNAFNSANYSVDVVYFPSTSMAGAPPALIANATSLNFQGFTGASSSPSQIVNVYNEGAGSLNWTASTNQSWIVLSATSGATPQNFSVSVNPAGLAVGTYTGTITLTAPGATNGPQTISVNLTVTNLLLSSTFSTQGMQGWIVSPLGLGANWSIANSALLYNGGGNSQIFAGNSAWTDYTVTTAFQLANMQNYPGGLRGRVNPSTGAGYMAWVYPATGQIILYRASAWSVNQPLVQIGAAGAALDTANVHSLSLAFKGSQIQVLYDGNTVITVSDSTYASGLIALEGDSQPISFQNVLVTSDNSNTGSFAASPGSLSFSGMYGGANPAAQSAQISTTGTGVLAWTAASSAAWLSVTPSSGVTPATLQISANTAGLAGGTYTGAVTVVSLGAVTTTRLVNVTLTVNTAPPTIVLSPTSLNFIANLGQSAPPAQTVSMLNGGYGTFSWTVASDSSWLAVSPASGSAPGTVSVNINPNGLTAGSYNGNLTLSASGVSNSPVTVPVSLQVLSPDMNESFADQANGWIISPMGGGTGWSVSNGVYSYSGIGLSQSCTGNAGWSDYTFDANIKLTSLSNWPGGVRARVNPSTGAGYAVWLYPASGIAVLYKVGQWDVNGSILTTLAQVPLTFDTTASHDLRMDFSGSVISVSWDGTPLMAANDASYASGFVCLDADNQPISYSNVKVAAVQNPVALDAPSPSRLVFSSVPGAAPVPQTIHITAGGASVAWTAVSSAAWLTAAASSTLTPGDLTITANSSGLAEGTYTATVTLYAPGATNSSLTIPVTLAVKTAVLSVAPASLTFFAATGSNPPAQNIQVVNLGSGNLNWTASNTSAWLGLGAASGSAPASIAVQPNLSGLNVGTYSDTVTISSPDVANSPATAGVSLHVGNLLFSDNFSSGAGNWTISPLGFASGWSVSNGAYNYNGEGHTQSWAGNNAWTDYTVAVNFQLSSLNDYPGGIRGRVNTDTGASYGVWIYPAEGILKLYRIGQWNIDAGYALLGQSAVTVNTSVHNLRLNFQGATIQVYYDNALVITVADSTYTQGAIALDVSNQPIAFSNVSVIGY